LIGAVRALARAAESVRSGAALPDRIRDPAAWRRRARPFLLGTDDQGATSIRRSSTACAISLVVGVLGVLLAAVLGITLGLLAGYVGGRTSTASSCASPMSSSPSRRS
jgi:ABC-type dipeptide/oligopeptide/nickel transport system permease subunit